jgi:glutathione S-transferase
MHMTPTLYYSPGACSLAPHIALEEIGLPFDLAQVSTSDGSTHTAKHLKLNPKGRVPVLVTGDSALTEAPAILVHLAMQHPDKQLLASTPDALVRSMEWCNWLSGTVHAVAIRQVWRPESFTDLPHIEARLAKTDWAVGERYSVVDPYLLVFFRWGNRIGFDMRGHCAAWTQHTLRVIERPATARALATENISVWQ